MARTLTMTFFILTLFSLPSQGQTDFRVMSYNVENLFDTKDDLLTADNDFLPSGNRHWTSGRFYHKLQQLAKVITAAGEWSTPALSDFVKSKTIPSLSGFWISLRSVGSITVIA